MANTTHVQITGFEELDRNARRVAGAVGAAKAKKVYADAGSVIQNRAKQLAPYDSKRKKGVHLRDAIFMYTRNPRESFVIVGVRYEPRGAPHAHLLEFGHATRNGGFAPPKPYMRPAVTGESANAGKIIREGLLAIIEDAAQGK